MSDESVLGLLLRAHSECAAQEHGEKYVFANIPASQHWETAKLKIEDAIRQIGFAEMRIAQQGDRKK